MLLRAVFLYLLGVGILFVNKIRYTLLGYHRPRPFAVADQQKAIAYGKETVERWERTLVSATQTRRPFLDKRVVELGPGAVFIPGLSLLAFGAKTYTGLDKNALLADVPTAWYEPYLATVPDASLRQTLHDELLQYTKRESSHLSWIHDPDFRLRPLSDNSIDVIVSNNAFEHFDDIRQTLADSDRVLVPGGWLCAHIDLQTHTGVIRDRDPLNIYRYPQWLYGLAKFPGIPNRVRPEMYEKILQSLGWKEVRCIPVCTISPHDGPRHLAGVSQKLLGTKDRALWLSFLLIGQKPANLA